MALIAKLTAYQQEKADWIMQSTAASYEGLSYNRLFKIRDFAHAGGAVKMAYPDLKSHYFEVGDPAFQRAQKAKLDAFYAQ